MPSDWEDRILRLEAQSLRLESGLAAAEARATGLEQARPMRPAGGGPVAVPPFPVVINEQVTLSTQPPGNWAGTTVTTKDGSGTTVGSGTTDAWGFTQYWFNIDGPGQNGQVYSNVYAHAGFTTQTRTFTIHYFVGDWSFGAGPVGSRNYTISL